MANITNTRSKNVAALAVKYDLGAAPDHGLEVQCAAEVRDC